MGASRHGFPHPVGPTMTVELRWGRSEIAFHDEAAAGNGDGEAVQRGGASVIVEVLLPSRHRQERVLMRQAAGDGTRRAGCRWPAVRRDWP